MNTIEFKLPDIGDFEDVEIIEILAAEGEVVEEEQSLLTLESDKAAMEIPVSVSGIIAKWHVAVGDRINEGDLLATIESNNISTVAVDPPLEPTEQTETDGTESSTINTSPTTENDNTDDTPKINKQPMGAQYHASPSIRRLARLLGADLSFVTGTGHKGRITKDDVESYIKSILEGSNRNPQITSSDANTGSGIPAVPVIDFTQFGEIEETDLLRIQKISGKHLHASWLNIPHVTQFDEADTTELEDFRKSLKQEAEKIGINVTPLAFIIKAVVATLKQFPQFNASLDENGEKLILKKYFNIGIAVDTPKGLVVPVVRNVEHKSIYQISKELMDLSKRAREGKLTIDDMQGGTFTISSLGGIGGTQFTPIVNAPEVAILGVSRAKTQPVWDGKEFKPRLIMPVALSYDHRVIDGAVGVRFTTHLAQCLSDFRRVLL